MSTYNYVCSTTSLYFMTSCKSIIVYAFIIYSMCLQKYLQTNLICSVILWQNFALLFSHSRTVNAITKGFRANERRQLPWPTLLIRWQIKRTHPGYDIITIREILSKYGAIREIRLVSINSVMVIFQDVSTACDIMMAPGVGDIDNLLHPSWWHMAMRDKFVSSSKKGVLIKTDPFIK